MSRPWRYVTLSGGVGGAKLALGMTHAVDPEDLLVVANTGDDFEHLGLTVCPDLDTLMYTLAGLANPETGWGRAGETGTFMRALAALGGETWFFLGDGDLATHVERTRRLRAGESLAAITADFCKRLGIAASVVPMSDDPVRTMVQTPAGELAFQHYFVREQCRPAVTGFRFDGAERARPHPELLTALAGEALEAVLIAPSNPYISIDPILAVPGVRQAVAACRAPVVAVSPIVGGRAIKGPTAKMMAELGLPATVLSVAEHYHGLIDGLVLDREDGETAARQVRDRLGLRTLVTDAVMTTLEDRVRLAREAIRFAAEIGRVAEGLTARRRPS